MCSNRRIKRIKHNRIQCRKCGDVVESKKVYDFVTCSCKSCYVDGGKCYVHIGAFDMKDVLVLTEYEDDDKE